MHTLSKLEGVMVGKHTIFDQRRRNWDEDIDRPVSLTLITRPVVLDRDSAFLAERGEITASNYQLAPPKPH